MEDASNRVLERHSVHTLVLEHQKKVDQISGTCRAATFVGTRVGVQLFGDLPLQRNQQHLDRGKTDYAQESWWSLGGLSIPRIGDADTDVYRERLE
jgi:hypothetical protein